jgi:hypothetical protein
LSKTGDMMYCAKTSGASIGQPDTIFSAIGKFFGRLFGGNPAPESRAAVDLCRQRYGLETCNGECVDFRTDDNNCGGCGNWCNSDPGYSIDSGSMYTCNEGQCVRRDEMEGPGSYRCGIGGTTECPAGAPCLEGVCSALGCLDPEMTDCNNICVRTSEDEANCGSCGHACQLNQTCRGGTCADECEDPGTGFCRSAIDGHRYCADLSTDPDHCGTCQHTCPSPMVCGNGECVSECPAGLTLCGNVCTDILKSRRSCGECGHGCNNDEICSGGTCVRCPEGTTSCWDYDHCVDFRTDEWNCGNCGRKCGEGDYCTDGTCKDLGTMGRMVMK